ncbi:MAG: hypothetical protein Q8P99_02400, partial [bacterium]|nr:hypothetical protein [bacterium]
MVSKYESLETEEPPVISDQRLLRYREDLRTRMEFFLNHAGEGKPYKREEIEGDILKCKQQREKWGATNVRSSLAEIIIALVPHSSGWLGERTRERGRHTIVTEEPDDFFYNHIDCVKEISYATAGTVVRWAEDVTRHHPENDYAQDTPQTSESFGQVEAKVLGMREAIGKGKSPGEVHYFSSVASEEDLETPLIGPMPMPKAIISVPSKVALELR